MLLNLLVGLQGVRRGARAAGMRARVPLAVRRSVAEVAADVPPLPNVAVPQSSADASRRGCAAFRCGKTQIAPGGRKEGINCKNCEVVGVLCYFIDLRTNNN